LHDETSCGTSEWPPAARCLTLVRAPATQPSLNNGTPRVSTAATCVDGVMRTLTALAIASVILASPAFAQDADEYPTEYKLAVIQTGGYVDPDDKLVGQFAAALDDLEASARTQEPTRGLRGGDP
jgi:hypothetical protein